MAALLVRLRWRQLGHQLGRSRWMIVTLVITGLVALWLLGLFAVGLGALRVWAPEITAPILVLVGAVIVLGWWIGSILVSSDDSLAPERFALLPVRARSLLPGLVTAGATTIGGIGTAVALLLMLVGWSVSLPALLAALVLTPLALVTCVLGARVVSGLLAGWLAGRRARDLVVIVGVLLVVCSGLIFNVVLGVLMTAEVSEQTFAELADIVAWTPLGAVFGVPAALAAEQWLEALLRLLIALATVASLWIVAERQLARRLSAPIIASGGGRIRSGGLVDRMLPATPAGAIAARTLRLQRRDPRRIVNVAMLLVLPAVLVGVTVMNGLGEGGVSFGAGVVLIPAIGALLIGTIVQMEVAYDNDAVALHIHTGVSGTADRVGRVIGIGIVAVPITVVLCALTCALAGRWDLLPASLGGALGPCLVAAGAGAWVGAFLPGRAPAPEANPLGRGSSGGTQSMLAMLIIVPIALLVGGPALGFAIAALVSSPAFGWVSLACALVLGGGTIWAGSVLGGRVLERRWPEVLAAVSSES